MCDKIRDGSVSNMPHTKNLGIGGDVDDGGGE